MANVQQSTDFARDTTSVSASNRKVWILNSDFRRYEDEYRGKLIVIPPNSERIPKHANEGGNIMEYVAARKFLGQPKNLFLKDAKGNYIETPKALRTEELTEDEYKTIFGVKTEVDEKADEKKAKRAISRALKSVKNKVEVTGDE